MQEYWIEQARRALDIHALPAYAGLRVDKGINSGNGRAVHMQHTPCRQLACLAKRSSFLVGLIHLYCQKPALRDVSHSFAYRFFVRRMESVGGLQG